MCSPSFSGAAPLVLAAALAFTPLGAQEAPIAPYRAPVIALVQPKDGDALPHNKPVVVFRFAPGEPSDPLDLTSFRVAVAMIDRTQLFTITASEAWGPLVEAAGSGDSSTFAGTHELTARICSIRGVCSSLSRSIPLLPTTLPAAVRDSTLASGTPTTRRQRLIELLLEAAKRLFLP